MATPAVARIRAMAGRTVAFGTEARTELLRLRRMETRPPRGARALLTITVADQKVAMDMAVGNGDYFACSIFFATGQPNSLC